MSPWFAGPIKKEGIVKFCILIKLLQTYWLLDSTMSRLDKQLYLKRKRWNHHKHLERKTGFYAITENQIV